MMDQVRANAWTGSASLVGPGIDPESPWALSARAFLPRPSQKLMLPAAPPDDRDWAHPKVGWGVVMPDDDRLSDADKASGEDAPAPIKRLLTVRIGAPILRYRAGSMNGYLRRYFSDGRAPSDLDVSSSRNGIGEGEIPKYLLLYGGPKQIPWRTQYALNMSRCVGRLHLEGDALERYVDHLVGIWPGVECDPLAPVVWSVNFGEADITCLMQQVIADRFWKSIAADADFAKAIRLADGAATGSALANAMATHPGLVVTTSHGMTGPEQKPGSEPDQIGLPVDADRTLLSPAVLPEAAIPGGAIWYAHACCSAGADAKSQCADLFPSGDTVGDTLRSVSANAGDCVAPLPGRLLGADKPLRAFIGHVEPTFDWMLRDPNTKQAVGDVLANALYWRLYQKGTPIGLALSEVYSQSGSFLTLWRQAIGAVNEDVPGSAELARYWQVAALDRQSMVILGDPTVTLPLK
jgi:hypothetical protein